jgi:hypothetical protein
MVRHRLDRLVLVEEHRHAMLGASRISILAAVALLASLVTSEANADENTGSNRHRLLLELGPDVTVAIGRVCERGGDWEGCGPGLGAAGFSAHAGWLLGERLALGVFGAYQWAPNGAREGDQNGWTNPISETVLWMAAEARWEPWSPRFYLKVYVGAVRYRQEYHPYNSQDPEAAVSQWAPAAGLGVAWLLLQAGRFSFAIDLRMWITAFGSDPPVFFRGQTAKDLGVLPWFSFGLQFGIRP